MSKKITATDIKNAFYMEPEDAVKFFQAKGLKTSFDWHEVYEEAHAKAFTVAKMMDIDLLKDTQDMLNKSLKEGWSFSHFKREAMNLYADKGWVGYKKMTDPKTGKEKTVELGTPRRLKTIYNSNMRSAYAASRYKQQLEDADIAPYFQYICVLDGKTRPEHKAMHEKVFRYDDPIWQSIYPPNGWNCRCMVKSLSERELERKELKAESSEGHLRDITEIVGGEEKTVTAYDFKVGGENYTLKPDAGWSTNIGTHAWGIDVAAYNKVKDLPQNIKDKFISDMAQNIHRENSYKNFVEKTLKNGLKAKGMEEVVSWVKPDLLNKLYSEKISPKTPIIVMQDKRIGHIVGDVKIAKQKLSNKQLKKLYNIINNPDEVYLDVKDNSLIYLRYLAKNEIIDNRDVIKVPVKLNRKNDKHPINYISTAGRVSRASFIKETSRYKKIE